VHTAHCGHYVQRTISLFAVCSTTVVIERELQTFAMFDISLLNIRWSTFCKNFRDFGGHTRRRTANNDQNSLPLVLAKGSQNFQIRPSQKTSGGNRWKSRGSSDTCPSRGVYTGWAKKTIPLHCSVCITAAFVYSTL